MIFILKLHTYANIRHLKTMQISANACLSLSKNNINYFPRSPISSYQRKCVAEKGTQQHHVKIIIIFKRISIHGRGEHLLNNKGKE